jgi:hypothetical protein
VQTIEDALYDPDLHWQALGSLLTHSLSSVSLLDRITPDIAGWLERLPQALRDQADEASRHFVAKWCWPDVQGELRNALFFRALFSAQRCYQNDFLRHPHPPYSDFPYFKRTLEHLLIEEWKTHHHQWAKRHFPLDKEPTIATFLPPIPPKHVSKN